MNSFESATDPYQISSAVVLDSILTNDYRIVSLRGERVNFQGAVRLFVDITIKNDSGKTGTILMVSVEENPQLSIQFPSCFAIVGEIKTTILANKLARLLEKEKKNGKLPSRFDSVPGSEYTQPQKASERLMPGYAPYGTLIAHLQRYRFAKAIAGRRTSHLDLGCGLGYGLSMLGCSAGMGIDISTDAISLARQQYGESGFSFLQADLAGLELGHKFDVATSFEVIEHLPDHHILLKTVVRNIERDGLFIISIPNPTYHGSILNPYHLHDITPAQMTVMLESYFEAVEYFHQGHDIHGDLDQRYLVKSGLDPEAEFWLAVARTPRPLRTVADVSIVIPVYNKCEFTAACLSSLRRLRSSGTDFEVIVVDNASSDGTAEYLAGMRGEIAIWRNEQNLGFAKACNQGAVLAQGSVIVFLNNDTEVHPGCLNALVDELRCHPETGIVGGRLLYPDGTIQHAGVAIGRDQIPFHIHRQLAADHPLVMERRTYPIVTAACAAVRREEFYRIGMFDEAFVNGHEDIDLCFRYREKGQEVVYRPDCVVTHHESVSEGRMASRPQNLARTFKKWRYQLIQDDFRYAFPESSRGIVDNPLRFAIKIGTPDRTLANWGDIYYAECLAKALSRAGHSCQIHYLCEWGRDDLDIDVVIHLKGLSEYKPKPYNINIMWMLNHPTLHRKEELERYDAILVASLPHAFTLKKELNVPVFPFLQATDPEHFRPCPEINKKFDLVFVGNNTGTERLAMRQIIADLLPTPYRLAVWGQGWEGKLPPGVLQGDFIPWQDLPKAYASGHIVLNDHQPEMKAFGFVNNRTFDAVACGATVVSDYVAAMEQVLPVSAYSNRDGLQTVVDTLLTNPAENSLQVHTMREQVLKEFTFDRRVEELLKIIAGMQTERARVKTVTSTVRSYMSEEKPLVSVLMSTYNRKRFLPAAIESIKAQGYPYWELLLVNDGGTNVDDVVRRAADGRIRLVNLEVNKGKGYAINRAFHESKGLFIAYLDDDDIWYPDHLERLLLPLVTIPGIEMAYSDAYDVWLTEKEDHVFTEINRQLRYYKQIVFDNLFGQNFIQGMSVVHRRELFERVGGMDEKLKILIDWDLWRRLAAHTYPYHVSRVTADHFFRESLETTGKGQITSLARADLVRFETNKLRVIKKRFSDNIEEHFSTSLSPIRAKAKCDFLSARISEAENKGDFIKARRRYRIAIRIAKEERIGWLQRYAEFELLAGMPLEAMIAYEEAITLAREQGRLNYFDIMMYALINFKINKPQIAQAILSQLKGNTSEETIIRFIDRFSSKFATPA